MLVNQSVYLNMGSGETKFFILLWSETTNSMGIWLFRNFLLVAFGLSVRKSWGESVPHKTKKRRKNRIHILWIWVYYIYCEITYWRETVWFFVWYDLPNWFIFHQKNETHYKWRANTWSTIRPYNLVHIYSSHKSMWSYIKVNIGAINWAFTSVWNLT